MAKPAPDRANAQPSKNFFVNMLVRDIELKDTLLDLLDNCVDGILRNTDPDLSAEKPYTGFRADFVIGPGRFELRDNCGGIPINIARNSAFAVGNPNPITGEEGVATVGMYGIGMKRAIFKLGRNAYVESWSDEPFRVTIDKKWLDNNEWSPLPLEVLGPKVLREKGTRIVVDELRPEAALEFGVDGFAQDLAITIAQTYALIIAKGFEVTVRRKVGDPIPAAIKPAAFRFLQAETPDARGQRLAPFVFLGKLRNVEVEVYAGLYRRLPDEQEREAEEETRGSVDDAGWTIACNDRIVVWKDRSRLTGWGEATVPNFHGQFIAISGIVLLRSRDPHDLPLTTTKRGIDAGAEIYSFVKDMMREATKALTTFTNKWKKFEGDLDALYRSADYLELRALRATAPSLPLKPWLKSALIERYAPKLPVPEDINTSARVSFVAPKADVAKLGVIYFEDARAAARDVGQEAFRRELDHYAEAAE